MNIRCSETKSERDPSYKEGQERATRKVRKGLQGRSGKGSMKSQESWRGREGNLGGGNYRCRDRGKYLYGTT